MNKIMATGRLTKDVELKETSSKIPYCRFNLACKSKQKADNGEPHSDFFICIAWRNTAETIAKYCTKGSFITVYGSMGSRSYKNERGESVTVWELNVEDMEFASQKGEGEERKKIDPSLKEIEDDDNLPF